MDTDSDVQSTEVSIPSLEQLGQIRVDRFKTLFSNNPQALLPTNSPSYSSSTISSSNSSLNVNINPPSTPCSVASQDIASYSMSTTSTNDTLISTVESPRMRLRPLRFRHSIGSPSLAMSSNSFKPIERDTPVTNTEQNISNTLRHCPDQSNQSANDEISVNTLLEPTTRRSTLSTRDTSAALGEGEGDRFFEECLYEGDDDDNQTPVNQVSFKGREAFIVEI